ncbi:MAG: serine hydrolase [Cyanobacteria bacterium P01_D01_bin.156]
MKNRLFTSPTSIQTMLGEIVSNGRACGVVVGLLDSDESRQIFTHGNAGSNSLPLSAESVFEIGSITKVFTSILLTDMVQRGEVELSEPLAKLLPFHLDMNYHAIQAKHLNTPTMPWAS